MPEVRCPNCGTRFDPAGVSFCPNADCGFPVDFMGEPDAGDATDEPILRRPDETDEIPPVEPPGPEPPREPPPEADVTQVLPPVHDLPPEPASPPAFGPATTGGRRVPRGVVVGAVAAALVLLVAIVAVAMSGRGDDVVAGGADDAAGVDDVADDAADDVADDEADGDGDGGAGDDGADDAGGTDDDGGDDGQPATIDVQVVLVDGVNVENNQQPFVTAVPREIPHPRVDPGVGRNLLQALFEGPTPEEFQAGLRLVTSDAAGVTNLAVSDGVFTLQLTGGCNRGGLAVTIADQIVPTLKQLSTVDFVKILDPNGQTQQPDGASDSIPACLE